MSKNPEKNPEQRVSSVSPEDENLSSDNLSISKLAIFKALADNTSDFVAYIDLNKEGDALEYVNPAGLAMIGRPGEDPQTIHISDTHPPEVGRKVAEEYIPIALEKGLWSGETRLCRADGSCMDVSQVIILIRDAEGVPRILGTIMRDITKSKQTEAELEQLLGDLEVVVAEQTQEVAIFKTMTENSIDCIALGTPEGKLTYANRACHTMFGYDYDEKEMLELPLASFWFEEDLPLLETVIPQAMDDGWNGEVRQKRKDGTAFEASLTIFSVEDEARHALSGVAAILRDVTARKEAEEALRESQALLTQAQAAVHLGHWDWNIVTGELYWSDEIYRIFGLTPREFEATYDAFMNSVYPEDREAVQNAVNAAVSEKQPYNIDHRIVWPDGTVRIVHEQGKVTYNDAGEPVRMIGMVRDITEQRQAEEEREQLLAEQSRLQQDIIEAQRMALQDLSTPIIPVMDTPQGGVIVMPLIGSIDTLRARDIMRALLEGISEHNAKFVILDVTGVPLMDTGIVNHLNKTIQAARLKGADTIVTGISDIIAETVVDLGIDWSTIQTLPDLQTGLLFALRKLGVRLSY